MSGKRTRWWRVLIGPTAAATWCHCYIHDTAVGNLNTAVYLWLGSNILKCWVGNRHSCLVGSVNCELSCAYVDALIRGWWLSIGTKPIKLNLLKRKEGPAGFAFLNSRFKVRILATTWPGHLYNAVLPMEGKLSRRHYESSLCTWHFAE